MRDSWSAERFVAASSAAAGSTIRRSWNRLWTKPSGGAPSNIQPSNCGSSKFQSDRSRTFVPALGLLSTSPFAESIRRDSRMTLRDTP